jgi:transposase
MSTRREAFVSRAGNSARTRAAGTAGGRPRSGSARAKSVDYGISDSLWARVEHLVPPYVIKAGAGRPPLSSRQVFEAVVYVLRTGCPWRSLPRRRFGSATSIHKRFLAWEDAGFFSKLWQGGLAEDEELEGIPWRWRGGRGASSHRSWEPAVRHRRRL